MARHIKQIKGPVTEIIVGVKLPDLECGVEGYFIQIMISVIGF
jgi:hypothetical protein